MKITRDGTVRNYPCQSPYCPKHWALPMRRWNQRIVSAIHSSDFAYFATLPVCPYAPDAIVKEIWNKFYNGLCYRHPRVKYCFVKEQQDGNVHLHGVIITEDEMDCDWVKKQWKKFHKKILPHHEKELQMSVTEVGDADAAARYITKTSYNSKRVDLLTRGFSRRLVLASQGFGLFHHHE